MKKTIVIEISLLFILSVLLTFTVMQFINSSQLLDNVHQKIEGGYEIPSDLSTALAYSITTEIFGLFACFADVALMIIIFKKDIISFSNFKEKIYSSGYKRKQKQIAELEQKLNELKKDE